MKKLTFMVAVLILIVSFGGCSSQHDVFPESGTSDYEEIPEGPYVRRIADWHIYDSADNLIDDADIVFTGKIVDIEFQVLDITNSLPASESTPDYAKELYTIYSVEVAEVYKGEADGNMKVRVMGGMVNYKVEEQLEVMNEGQSFNRELGISIWDEFYKAQCTIDEYYLFVLKQFDTGYPTILNVEQSIYSLTEPTKKHAIGNSEKVYYSGKVDKNNNPLISAYDVISAFGSNRAKEFCNDWKAGKYSSECEKAT